METKKKLILAKVETCNLVYEKIPMFERISLFDLLTGQLLASTVEENLKNEDIVKLLKKTLTEYDYYPLIFLETNKHVEKAKLANPNFRLKSELKLENLSNSFFFSSEKKNLEFELKEVQFFEVNNTYLSYYKTYYDYMKHKELDDQNSNSEEF